MTIVSQQIDLSFSNTFEVMRCNRKNSFIEIILRLKVDNYLKTKKTSSPNPKFPIILLRTPSNFPILFNPWPDRVRPLSIDR